MGRRRRPRTPIKEIHRADKHDKHTVTDTLQQQLRTNKHTVTDALQQQLRTMMSAIQGRKAFVQCAILVAVVLLALTANAAAQEHRGRHSRRHHDAVHHDAVHLDPRPGDYTLTYTHYVPATDPCDCRGGCQWVWGYNICYVRDPHRCGWANHSRLRPGEKWRHCPGG